MDPTSQYGKILAEKREKNRRQEQAKSIIMAQESDPGEMVANWSSPVSYTHLTLPTKA